MERGCITWWLVVGALTRMPIALWDAFEIGQALTSLEAAQGTNVAWEEAWPQSSAPALVGSSGS